ncbi:MAG TPA: hypothetical protein VIC87_04255 [Vicinamibacteria bacterium]
MLPALLVVLAACETPAPKAILDLTDLETYWVVDPRVGNTEYIAPAARFRVRNKSNEPRGAVEATATFRRVGEEDKSWGSAWERLAPAGKPLAPGQQVTVVLQSDGRYFSTGSPQSMFEHALFRDATVEIFLRVGRSGWVKFAAADVERRIGSRTLEASPSP